ncbi:MAG: hypothetical protein JXR32_10485 [Anaerolineaceae bacterium]|nr:hypothetical protein [Anaerolineaceae bacterium]
MIVLLIALIVVLNNQVPVSAFTQPIPSNDPSQIGQAEPPVADSYLYLPLIIGKPFPMMAGVYPNGYPSTNTINTQLKPLDAWVSGVTGGRSTSILGTFMDLYASGNYYANVTVPLTQVWDAGYTTFINLPAPPGVTAYQIAAGDFDSYIQQFARAVRDFSNKGTRFVYLAPLQEMNGGEWVAYGGDPGNYILAFNRFRSIFTQEGVPLQSVKWVFAPNGWTKPGDPLFEDYYPGDAVVDVVAISAYNFGYCPSKPGSIWEDPLTVFNNPTFANGFYLDRIRAMAPTKPIFIAQTASGSYLYPGSPSYAAKNQWLLDAYGFLSAQSHVKAVLYFNFDKECDWAFYIPGITAYEGYKTAINSYGYSYIEPSELMQIDHSVR